MVSGYNIIEWGRLSLDNQKILVIRPLLKILLFTSNNLMLPPLQIAVTNGQEKFVDVLANFGILISEIL